MPGDTTPALNSFIDRFARALARQQAHSVSRRRFLAGASALSLLAAVRGFRPVRARTATEALLDDTAAAEALMVTYLAVARTRASSLSLDDTMVRMIRSAQCEDGAHLDNLIARGGSPSTVTFTIADSGFADSTSFANTWMNLVSIMNGMYMAAARQAAESDQPDLVEVFYQIGAVEAQHFALLRLAVGERIPANRAFAEWQFDTVQDAIAAFRRLGFIEGSGTAYDYPGPGERYCRGVSGLVSETTSDQTAPDVTAAPPAPDASPIASPAAD